LQEKHQEVQIASAATAEKESMRIIWNGLRSSVRTNAAWHGGTSIGKQDQQSVNAVGRPMTLTPTPGSAHMNAM